MKRKHVISQDALASTLVVENVTATRTAEFVMKRISVNSWSEEQVSSGLAMYEVLSKRGVPLRHTVRMYSATTQKGFLNVVSDFAPSGSLATWLASNATSVSAASIAGWVHQAATALFDLHQMGFWHCALDLSAALLTEPSDCRSIKLSIPVPPQHCVQRAAGSSSETLPEASGGAAALSEKSDCWFLGKFALSLLCAASGNPRVHGSVAAQAATLKNPQLRMFVCSLLGPPEHRPLLANILASLEGLTWDPIFQSDVSPLAFRSRSPQLTPKQHAFERDRTAPVVPSPTFAAAREALRAARCERTERREVWKEQAESQLEKLEAMSKLVHRRPPANTRSRTTEDLADYQVQPRRSFSPPAEERVRNAVRQEKRLMDERKKVDKKTLDSKKVDEFKKGREQKLLKREESKREQSEAHRLHREHLSRIKTQGSSGIRQAIREQRRQKKEMDPSVDIIVKAPGSPHAQHEQDPEEEPDVDPPPEATAPMAEPLSVTPPRQRSLPRSPDLSTKTPSTKTPLSEVTSELHALCDALRNTLAQLLEPAVLAEASEVVGRFTALTPSDRTTLWANQELSELLSSVIREEALCRDALPLFAQLAAHRTALAAITNRTAAKCGC